MAYFVNELDSIQPIPTALIFDNTMSDRARFLYCFMASKPFGWDFLLTPLVEELGYGVVTLRKYINELIEHGWLSKGEQKNEGGVFGATEYILRKEPCINFTDTQKYRHAKNVSRCEKGFTINNINNIRKNDNYIIPTVSKDIDTTQQLDVDIKKENKEKKSIQKKEKKKDANDLFEQCWVAYHRKGSKKKAKEQWVKLSAKERASVMPHIRAYVASREQVYQRDFERYLRDKVFLDVVFQGKSVVYDPNVGASGEYRPATDGQIHWNEQLHCWLFTGFDESCIFDGYDDDNRPDGAEIRMNNGRGIVVWDATNKCWEKKK